MAGYNVALACGMDGWMDDGWLVGPVEQSQSILSRFKEKCQCQWRCNAMQMIYLPNGQIQWAKEMEETAALFNVWSQCRRSFRFADVKEP